MLDLVVRHLHSARVPFRLSSYPSEEAEPKAAAPLPPGGLRVDTRLVLLDGRAVLTCFPEGEVPDLAAVGAVLGGVAIEGAIDALPDQFRYAGGAIPPLGQLFGVALVVDERVTQSSVIVFRVFGESDYVAIPYEDFARLEQPRVASFASAGALEAHHA